MSTVAYERPVLARHQVGAMNKFSRVRAMEPQTHIAGVRVDELVEKYGSPLFVFSQKTMVSRYREMRDAFARRFARVRVAWSYKTNYLDAVCRAFHREGAWAEVVSEFEWEKARHLGIPGEHIHFNGPLKTEAVLRRVVPEGTIIHIDNFDELALLERIAGELGITPRVAIRVNLAVEAIPAWSRFGFNLESGQARTAAARIVTGGKLTLAGLHCHLGTCILDPRAYRDQAAKLTGLANDLRQAYGLVLSFLDIGGGFPSHSKLKAQYLPGEQASPSFDRYAEACAEGMAGLDYPPGQEPTIVLESGRALIDDAGSMVTTVVANKRMPDGQRGLVIDAGVNVLFTSYWYDHDVVPAQPFGGLSEPTVMYGPLCMNIDVVRDTVLFPPMHVGDRLVIRNVGAYNVTQWMQFITYRPAVVMVSTTGEHAIIRNAETLETILGPEEVPSWL
ncbi:MAG: diaminopimelate decarboxylase [Deltaproteobacteria bacterium]